MPAGVLSLTAVMDILFLKDVCHLLRCVNLQAVAVEKGLSSFQVHLVR